MMNNEWETPDELFRLLDEKFNFDFDLCSNGVNNRCDNFSTDIEDTYLQGEYKKFNTFWMNPPYSRDAIGPCMDIASKIASEGKQVVCLTRFDPTTHWFRDYVWNKAHHILMMNRRVKFRGAESGYNFPTCIIVYNGWRKIPTPTLVHLWDTKTGVVI